MRKKIQTVILSVMTLLAGYLVVANITHMMALRMGDVVTYQESSYEDDAFLKRLKVKSEQLNKNVEALKSINKTVHLDETQFKTVKEELIEANEKLQKSPFLTLSGEVKYTHAQIYKMLTEYSDLSIISMMQTYETIIEKDENCGFVKDEVTFKYLNSAYSVTNISEKVLNDYQYYTVTDTIQHALLLESKTIIGALNDKLDLVVELSDYLVKDGGING